MDALPRRVYCNFKGKSTDGCSWRNLGVKLRATFKTKTRPALEKESQLIHLHVVFFVLKAAEFQIQGLLSINMPWFSPKNNSPFTSIIFFSKNGFTHLQSHPFLHHFSRVFTTFCTFFETGYFTGGGGEAQAPRCCTSKTPRSAQFSGPKRQPKQQRPGVQGDGSWRLRLGGCFHYKPSILGAHPYFWKHPGGGNSNIFFIFTPIFLGKMNPFWRAYFSDGLVKNHQLVDGLMGGIFLFSHEIHLMIDKWFIDKWFIDHWFIDSLILDHWLWIIDYWLLIIDSLIMDYWLLIIDYWLWIIDYWLWIIDYWLLIIEYWLLIQFSVCTYSKMYCSLGFPFFSLSLSPLYNTCSIGVGLSKWVDISYMTQTFTWKHRQVQNESG